MNREEERLWIAEAVRTAYDRAGVPWPPPIEGPVPLHRLIVDSEFPTTHAAIHGLNHGAVSAELRGFGVRWAEVPDPDPRLDGFLYANADSAYIFVRQGDFLPRRRFSAAHELGHLLLHLRPMLESRGPGSALAHGDLAIAEGDESDEVGMERQANRFAAQILMPEASCRGLHERITRKYGPSTRFVVHHLASELLVSRAAAWWRLHELGLAPRPGRRDEGEATDDL